MGLHLTGSSLTQLNNAFVGRATPTQHAPGLGLYFPEAEGAVADGATNDTTALQAAHDAAYAAGGGMVFLQAKTYVGSVVLKSRVILAGAGRDATTIKAPNSLNGHVVKTLDFATLTGTNPNTTSDPAANTGPRAFGLRNLTVDGNKTNQTSGKCVALYGSDLNVSNVRTINGKQGGFYSEWSSAAGLVNRQSMESKVSHVVSQDNDGNGFDWNGPHDSLIDRVIAYGNIGVGIRNGTGAGGTLYHECHSWGSLQTYAWQFETPASCSNCIAEGAINGQLNLLSDRVVWIGGAVFCPSDIVNPVGIIIGDGTHSSRENIIHTRVTGCISGSLVINNDTGGSEISLVVDQTSGTKVVGSPHANTRVQMVAFDGASQKWEPTGGTNQTGTRMNLGGSTTRAIRTNVGGDANDRFILRASGAMEWGDGTNATDAFLSRTAAGVLTATGDLYARGNRVETTWSKPTAAKRANIPRNVPLSNQAAVASGTLRLTAIDLVAGDPVSFIKFCSGTTAAATPTNQWFSLYDANLNLIGVTVDDTTTAWAASAIKKLAMATPYTVPTSGFYYVGCVVVAGTVPSLSGIASVQGVLSETPVMAGASSASLTNPASAPTPAAALTPSGSMPWAQVL